MMEREMFWNIVFMKKMKKANFLTIQHMMHKEMLNNMENMKIIKWKMVQQDKNLRSMMRMES